MIFLFLLLLIGCTTSSPWNYRSSQSSSCLTYESKHPTRGIDLQILNLGNTQVSYLQVRSGLIAPSHEDPQRSWVTFSSKGESHHFLVERHQGGQRLQLNEQASILLQKFLKGNEPFTLEMAGFSETINPSYGIKKI